MTFLIDLYESKIYFALRNMFKLLKWRSQITWLCGMEFFTDLFEYERQNGRERGNCFKESSNLCIWQNHRNAWLYRVRIINDFFLNKNFIFFGVSI